MSGNFFVGNGVGGVGTVNMSGSLHLDQVIDTLSFAAIGANGLGTMDTSRGNATCTANQIQVGESTDYE